MFEDFVRCFIWWGIVFVWLIDFRVLKLKVGLICCKVFLGFGDCVFRKVLYVIFLREWFLDEIVLFGEVVGVLDDWFFI